MELSKDIYVVVTHGTYKLRSKPSSWKDAVAIKNRLNKTSVRRHLIAIWRETK